MTLDDLIALSKAPNVAAFLRVIREAESSQTDDAYRTLFGGGKFDGFASHPNQAVERMLGGKAVRSTAAGAYQFLSGTFREIASAYAITDFSPESQDAACVALIRRASALDDVIAGRFDAAIRKCASTWAGLPGDKYGQGGISMDRARAAYTRWGGTFEAPTTAAPITESQPTYTAPEVKPVAPILAALFPSIIAAIPELAKVFGSGSAVSERNAKAAEVVAQVVQQATGAVNVQQAVERVTTDPAARQAAVEAVQANWFQIAEAGGGGIEGARKQNIELAQSGIPPWEMPAFLISAVLLILLFVVVGAVLFGGGWNDQIKTQVVTAVLSVIGLVGAFWLGSSIGSQRKDRM